MKNWREILNKFADVRILIVGDVMLDRYLWGTVSRISPEAPVPVVRLEKQTITAGGAANVAANAAALGSSVSLVGIVGNDSGANEIKQILETSGVSAANLITTNNRQTTTKTRIVAHHQHVVRLDDETTVQLNPADVEKIIEKSEKLMPDSDVVVFSDYAKGCLNDEVLSAVIEKARKLRKPILIDPKGKNYRKYSGATLLTPNKIEAAAASGEDIMDAVSLQRAGEKLLADLQIEALLITLGEDGMQLFERKRESEHIPAAARKVYDVTGAGDTVIASLAVSLGANASFSEAAKIANAAAGIAVEQVGTTVVKKAELENALQHETGEAN